MPSIEKQFSFEDVQSYKDIKEIIDRGIVLHFPSCVCFL